MRFDLIVFDLDGTVVDSIGDIAGALNHVLQQQGYRAIPMETVTSFVGDGINMLVRRALQHLDATAATGVDEERITTLARAIQDRYLQYPCVETRPFAHIPAVLSTLRSTGTRLAILTNKPGNVARSLLHAVALAPSFSDVIGDMDGHGRKPDPAGAHELIRRAGTNAARTLIVGDGVPDLQVSRAVGAVSAAALWGYSSKDKLLAETPDHVLHGPADLLAVV